MENEVESGSESGVSQSTESQTPESQSPAASQSAEGSHEASAQSATDKQTPFHEHPRFKELVSQKNEYAQKMQTYEQQLKDYAAQMQEMQRQMQDRFKKPEPAKPDYGQVLERLQGIDPEFGKLQQELYSKVQMIEQLEQQLQGTVSWQQQAQQEQAQRSAMNRLSELYTQYKVSDEHKPFYEAQIEAEAYRNSKAGLKDLDNIFKNAHDKFSKFTDSYSRQIRESYVAGKNKDKTPATQSGGTPASPQGTKSNSLDDVKAAIANTLRQRNQKI